MLAQLERNLDVVDMACELGRFSQVNIRCGENLQGGIYVNTRTEAGRSDVEPDNARWDSDCNLTDCEFSDNRTGVELRSMNAQLLV